MRTNQPPLFHRLAPLYVRRNRSERDRVEKYKHMTCPNERIASTALRREAMRSMRHLRREPGVTKLNRGRSRSMDPASTASQFMFLF